MRLVFILNARQQSLIRDGATVQLLETKLFDLTDQIALVTGGGGNIGTHLARALAAFGADVHITDINLETCKSTIDHLAEFGLRCTAHRCDAANEEEMTETIKNIQRIGPLSIAIANAGAAGTGSPSPYISQDQYSYTLRNTLTSAFVTAQTAARAMLPEKYGRIIFIASIHGFVGADARVYNSNFPRSGADYHCAKGAVINLTRSLSCEYGNRGITVNCVSPGQIENSEMDQDMVKRFQEANPLHRSGHARDIQGATLLLASAAGAFINGHNLVVDGGWTAW